MSLSDITYESVISAIEEFQKLGKAKFLEIYGYGDARNYYLLYEGEEYPSKAIAGVAHKYINPGNEPLSSGEFSGGKFTVEPKLRSLGFNVVYHNKMTPIVLVENEVTYGGEYDHWQDLTGVSYQYPNQYRNKILPGRQFVYYRGVRRADNKRGKAEYFGYGRISSVWRDPTIPEDVSKSRWRWYCSIEDYIPFSKPIPAKQSDDYIEIINNPLGWRTAVREISEQQFERILSLAGIIDIYPPEIEYSKKETTALQLPRLDDVVVQESEGHFEGFVQGKNPAKEPLGVNKSTGSYRRTRNSKQIGDRAEEIVLRWLSDNISSDARAELTWVAQEGITPGWDIEFIDKQGELIAVEVKGTTGTVFQSIEVTAQEWQSAKDKENNYWLILVTECHSTHPKITKIVNPYSLLERGELQIEPVLWRLRR